MRIAPEIQARIDAMVEELKKANSIRTEGVEHALRAVPRHAFLEWYFDEGKRVNVEPTGKQLDVIYSDVPLVTRLDQNGTPRSSTSQPTVVASMLEALDVHPGMRVLEIGTGTGYNAACIAEIVGEQAFVTTIDIRTDVVEQSHRLLERAGYGGIDVRAADGFFGASEAAPFDRIIVTVGAPDVSPHWVEQLAPGGLMIVPLGQGGWHPHVRVWREGERTLGRFAGWTGFMPMEGALSASASIGRDEIVHREDDTLDIRRFIEPLGDEYSKLWWFATLTDPRIKYIGPLRNSFGFGLIEDGRHWALLGQIGVFALDAPKLADDLEATRRRWIDLGKPRQHDFLFEFVPEGSDRNLLDGEWIIQRKLHKQYVRISPD